MFQRNFLDPLHRIVLGKEDFVLQHILIILTLPHPNARSHPIISHFHCLVAKCDWDTFNSLRLKLQKLHKMQKLQFIWRTFWTHYWRPWPLCMVEICGPNMDPRVHLIRTGSRNWNGHQVVQHKAVASHGWQSDPTDGSRGGWSLVPSMCLSVYLSK